MVSAEEPQKDEKVVTGPLERLFRGNATAKMLDFLITMQEFDYSESDIARHSGVSIRHAIREMPFLEELDLVRRTRTSGRSKMFKLNKDSKTGSWLQKWSLSLAQVENKNIINAEDDNKKSGYSGVSVGREEEDELIA